MTDPFEFEPRFEARLSAHAARASRPFDAAAIATSATAARPADRTLTLPWPTNRPRLAVAVVLGLTLLAAIIGTALLSGRLPDPLALIAPVVSPSAGPTESGPTPEPTARPSTDASPTPAPSSPVATPAPTNPIVPAAILLKTGHEASDTWQMPCDNLDRIDPVTNVARRLIDCADRLSISADGAKAAIGGATGVAIINLSDGRQVDTIETGRPTYPISWSPTGRWLQVNVCAHRDSTPDYGPCHVTIADMIDRTQVVLPGGGGAGYSPSEWMPDESHLLVPGPGPTEMRIGDPDGTDLAPLADDSAQSRWWWRSYGRAAAVSPDGAQLAYAWGPSVNNHMPVTDLWVMSIDGTDKHALTSFEPGAALREVAWSPDGRRMAFIKNLPSTSGVGPDELWFIESDGSQRRIEVQTDRAGAIDWSPDGARIALQGSSGAAEGSSVDTYIVALDGSEPVILKDARGLAWSPDGRSIAVIHTSGPTVHREGDPIPPATVDVVNVDGSDRHRVATPTGDLDGFYYRWAAP